MSIKWGWVARVTFFAADKRGPRLGLLRGAGAVGLFFQPGDPGSKNITGAGFARLKPAIAGASRNAR